MLLLVALLCAPIGRARTQQPSMRASDIIQGTHSTHVGSGRARAIVSDSADSALESHTTTPASTNTPASRRAGGGSTCHPVASRLRWQLQQLGEH